MRDLSFFQINLFPLLLLLFQQQTSVFEQIWRITRNTTFVHFEKFKKKSKLIPDNNGTTRQRRERGLLKFNLDQI